MLLASRLMQGGASKLTRQINFNTSVQECFDRPGITPYCGDMEQGFLERFPSAHHD